METSENINELVSALAIAQGAIEGAKKDVDNPFLKKKYADLQSVWLVARKPLSENGISVVQTPENTEKGISLRTTIFHSSGQWIASTLDLPVIKDEPQGYGTAISYARRYSLAAMIGVYSEDDDGNTNKKGPKDPGYKTAKKAIEHIRSVDNLRELKEACGMYQDDYQSGATGWTKPAWNTLCSAMSDVKDKLEATQPPKSQESESEDLANSLKPKDTPASTETKPDPELENIVADQNKKTSSPETPEKETWLQKLTAILMDPEYQSAIDVILKEKKVTPQSIKNANEESASIICDLLMKQKDYEVKANDSTNWTDKLTELKNDPSYIKIINDLVVSGDIKGQDLNTMHNATAKGLCELLERTKGFESDALKENLDTQPVDENEQYF